MGWSSFGQILRRLQKTNNSCDHLNSLLDRGRTNFAIRSILSASLSYQSPIYTAKCENVRHPGRSNSTVLISMVHGAVYWWCSTTTGRGRERLYDCSVSLIEQQMASRSARTRSYQLFNERLRSLTPNSSRQEFPRPDKILFVLPTNVLTNHYKRIPLPMLEMEFCLLNMLLPKLKCIGQQLLSNCLLVFFTVKS